MIDNIGRLIMSDFLSSNLCHLTFCRKKTSRKAVLPKENYAALSGDPACYTLHCVQPPPTTLCRKELRGHSCSMRGMSGDPGWKPGPECKAFGWRDDLKARSPAVRMQKAGSGKSYFSRTAGPKHSTSFPAVTQWLCPVYNLAIKHENFLHKRH